MTKSVEKPPHGPVQVKTRLEKKENLHISSPHFFISRLRSAFSLRNVNAKPLGLRRDEESAKRREEKKTFTFIYILASHNKRFCNIKKRDDDDESESRSERKKTLTRLLSNLEDLKARCYIRTKLKHWKSLSVQQWKEKKGERE